MFDAIAAGNDIDAAIDTYMAEDFVEHEAVPGMGVPASGNRVGVDAIDILQFRGEKCIAHWGVMDMAGMMEQMGATPPS